MFETLYATIARPPTNPTPIPIRALHLVRNLLRGRPTNPAIREIKMKIGDIVKIIDLKPSTPPILSSITMRVINADIPATSPDVNRLLGMP
jgi:hypothetical protein